MGFIFISSFFFTVARVVEIIRWDESVRARWMMSMRAIAGVFAFLSFSGDRHDIFFAADPTAGHCGDLVNFDVAGFRMRDSDAEFRGF